MTHERTNNFFSASAFTFNYQAASSSTIQLLLRVFLSHLSFNFFVVSSGVCVGEGGRRRGGGVENNLVKKRKGECLNVDENGFQKTGVY